MSRGQSPKLLDRGDWMGWWVVVAFLCLTALMALRDSPLLSLILLTCLSFPIIAVYWSRWLEQKAQSLPPESRSGLFRGGRYVCGGLVMLTFAINLGGCVVMDWMAPG